MFMWQILNNEARSLLASNEIEDMTLTWSAMEGAVSGGTWESDGRLIAQCTSLKRLCLKGFSGATSKNWLGRFETILRGLAQNRSIEELRLDGYGPTACRSPTEPDEFVHFFDILSPFFEHNDKFRVLWLTTEELEEIMFAQGTQQLVAAIEKCSSLEEFELKCSREDADQFGGDILTALKNSPSNLTKLSLKGGSNWNGCVQLGELIQQSPLEWLCISENQINNDGAALLGRVLGEMPSLKTLQFCWNADDDAEATMTSEGWSAFLSFLRSPKCSLEVIYLSWNPMGDDSAIAIAEAIATSGTLKQLSFCHILDISPSGWCSFFAKLLQGPSLALERLFLRNCSSGRGNDGREIVDDEIATSLMNALAGNKTLRELDLSQFNSIGQDGCQIIMSSLQKLLFNQENLGAIISSNHTLDELFLENGWLTFPSNNISGMGRGGFFALTSLLELNQHEDKDFVVGVKILHYYDTSNPTDEDDERLLKELRKEPGDLDIKVMPFVLAWAGRNLDLDNTLLYRLIRRLPTVFSSDIGNPSVAGKRKRG